MELDCTDCKGSGIGVIPEAACRICGGKGYLELTSQDLEWIAKQLMSRANSMISIAEFRKRDEPPEAKQCWQMADKLLYFARELDHVK